MDEGSSTKGNLKEFLQQNQNMDHQQVIFEHLEILFRETLKMDATIALDPASDISRFGMDSLMILEVLTKLNQALGNEIPMFKPEILRQNTLGGLSKAIAACLNSTL